MHEIEKNTFFYRIGNIYFRASEEIHYNVRKYSKNIFFLLLVIILIVFTTCIFLFINKIFFMEKRAEMEERFYEYINANVDECLKYDTRYKQNIEFAKLKSKLPLQPLKMTLSTAVFLVTDVKPYVVLKRIIVNKNAPLYEDKIALTLEHKNLIKSLKSERRTYKDSKGEIQNLIWLYMEYLPIKIGQKYVNSNEDTIRNIAADVLEGIAYLHSKGIAHLDLKIANILGYNEDGKVRYKIIDFGYSREIDSVNGNEEVKIPSKNYGTYPYKPPEIVFDNIHSLKSDIWCLGAIVWFLSNGQTPFYDENGNKATKEYKNFLYGHKKLFFRKEASRELKNFVKVCMNIDRHKRPTAEQLLKHKFITKSNDSFFFR